MAAPRLPNEAIDLGWTAIEDGEEARGLERELARELPPGHRLAGRAVRALARGPDDDDVLYGLPDDALAVVHLTWRRETDPEWPWTAVYDSPAAFVAAERDGV